MRASRLMKRGAPSLRGALLGVLVACLALELGTVGVLAPHLVPLALGLALALLGLSSLLIRRGFASLAAAAERLSGMARTEEWQRSLRAPALFGSGAHAQLEALRERLLERVERSQKLRERAQQAAAYKAGFLRSVRHELRTPLNSILGFSDVLLSDLEGPLTADQRESLQVIRSEGQKLSNLFDEVIELATVLSGQNTLERTDLDLGLLLEEVVSQQQPALSQRLVHVRLETDDELPPLPADADLVRRAAMGLLGYMLRVTTGHELLVRVGKCDDHLRLELVDPSRVLSTQELNLLLEHSAIQNRRAGLDEGSRLRLSICRRIATLHGGELRATSTPDAGTAFVLTFSLHA